MTSSCLNPGQHDLKLRGHPQLLRARQPWPAGTSKTRRPIKIRRAISKILQVQITRRPTNKQ